MAYKIAGIKDLKLRYVTVADPTTKIEVDVPFSNGFTISPNVNNITFEGDNDSDTIFSNADITGTLSADKFSPEVLQGAFGLTVLDGTNGAGVDHVTVGGSGASYTTSSHPVFSAAPDGGHTATGHYTAIVSGAPTGVTIDDPGSGYTVAPTVTNSGPGTGATFTAVLQAFEAGVDYIFYGGSNQEFNPSSVELVATAAAVDESTTPESAVDVQLVLMKAVIGPFKPGDLANRQKQTFQLSWSGKKTTKDITGAALYGVPSGGAVYALKVLDHSS